jgi:predicted dithiol-disulfide oxidoreductase (DUF899 family)
MQVVLNCPNVHVRPRVNQVFPLCGSHVLLSLHGAYVFQRTSHSAAIAILVESRSALLHYHYMFGLLYITQPTRSPGALRTLIAFAAYKPNMYIPLLHIHSPELSASSRSILFKLQRSRQALECFKAQIAEVFRRNSKYQ